MTADDAEVSNAQLEDRTSEPRRKIGDDETWKADASLGADVVRRRRLVAVQQQHGNCVRARATDQLGNRVLDFATAR